MKIDPEDKVFNLLPCEVDTLRTAALQRGLPFDEKRTQYTARELGHFGMVREAYNSEELGSLGFGSKDIVTSFDTNAERAREELCIDAPFGEDIRKWQIPVDVCQWRMFITEFSAGSTVDPHVHPEHKKDDPGGSLRVVLSGGIEYQGKLFKPGDWFYIPNGIPYSFRSIPDEKTVVMYSYRFKFLEEGNRFSHPIEVFHETAMDCEIA
ncbi:MULTISPECIES: hypothetical protein [Alphaproteobacteria]|uniref:cupin domain-containing protein n=1 Tax=Alphaproteobacteria TaxID=28211 RepID=UPI003299A226